MINIPGRKVNPVDGIAGRVWPNGRFGIGRAKNQGLENTPMERLKFCGREIHIEYHPELTPGRATGGNSGSSLGLSNGSNYHKSENDCPSGRPPRGSKGITNRGRNMVESGACLLQRRFSKKGLAFCTLTIPSVTKDEAWALSARWSEIVRQFFQRLRRLYARKGLRFSYVSCTEIQPERSSRMGYPALHLHFVCNSRYRRGYVFTPRELRSEWRAVISSYCSHGGDFNAVENVQRVKKDAGAYLGKYISKGTEDLEPLRRERPLGILPSSWYSMNMALKRLIAKHTITDRFVLAYVSALAKGMESDGVFHTLMEISIETENGPLFVGFAGKLTRRFTRSMHSHVWGKNWWHSLKESPC